MSGFAYSVHQVKYFKSIYRSRKSESR